MTITIKRQYCFPRECISVQNARPRRGLPCIYISPTSLRVRGKITLSHPPDVHHRAFPHRIFYRQEAHLASISPVIVLYLFIEAVPNRTRFYLSVQSRKFRPFSRCNSTFTLKATAYNFISDSTYARLRKRKREYPDFIGLYFSLSRFTQSPIKISKRKKPVLNLRRKSF